MRRRSKALIVAGIILAITIPTAFFVMNLLYPPPPEAFNLDDAPAEILLIKDDMKSKLLAGTFDWDDMEDFLTISQYIADNSPTILSMIEGWDRTIVFDITDAGTFWFIAADDAVTITAGSTPPTEFDVRIMLSMDIVVLILTQEETAISSYQKGNLDFTGPLGDAIKVDRLVQVIASTLMDTSITIVDTDLEFVITEDQPGLYEPGLTLMPCTEMIINNGSSTFGTGHLVVYDHAGRIIAKLDDTVHWTHKFINSTTVLMGGAGGFLELWNYKSGVVETLPIPGGHHEVDYNPVTDTFLVLEDDYSAEIWDGRFVLYDIVSEYSREGDLLWQWDGRDEYPFNSTMHTSLGLNETFRAGADWMHSNSFTWDKENDIIYLNVRNLDTVLKIDKTTKDIVWSAGRWGNFTVLNGTGDVVDSFFHHPHSLEWIGPNRFMVYDNDFYNPARPSTMVFGGTDGHSRLVEFVINETSQTMEEVWSWDPQNASYYFQDSGGDADRLPGGNTIGIFANNALTNSLADPVIITEVTPDGEVAWELQVPGENGTYYWTHRVERFYETPLALVDNDSIDYDASAGLFSFDLSVWNNFKEDGVSNGSLRVILNGNEVHTQTFEFLTHWQSNDFELSVPVSSGTVNYVQVIVTNDEGLERTFLIYGELADVPQIDFLVPLTIGIVVTIPVVIIVLVKTGKLNLKRTND